ncbi:MAG: zinc-ribbon domain-containing protein [Clostridiales bacterium]|nr:zinc-ribbon domain-containing protein [Clostridiales bacterium]
MTLSEKAAYLRGLYDGLGLPDTGTAEAKLLSAMIDVVEEMASHVTENEESITAMADQVDDLNEGLEELCDLISDSLDEEDYDDEDGEAEFEVECPKCQAPIILDEETLAGGQVVCQACGQKFSIDVGYEDEEDEEA